MKPVLKEHELYIGDNGRVFCAAHAGASALYTGRDISGQRVKRVTEKDRREWPSDLGEIECETCACIRRQEAP